MKEVVGHKGDQDAYKNQVKFVSLWAHLDRGAFKAGFTHESKMVFAWGDGGYGRDRFDQIIERPLLCEMR